MVAVTSQYGGMSRVGGSTRCARLIVVLAKPAAPCSAAQRASGDPGVAGAPEGASAAPAAAASPNAPSTAHDMALFVMPRPLFVVITRHCRRVGDGVNTRR